MSFWWNPKFRRTRATSCDLRRYGCKLHLVRPFGFEISDKYLKRAGLDYWHLVDISYYDCIEELFDQYPAPASGFSRRKQRKRTATQVTAKAISSFSERRRAGFPKSC